MSESVSSEIAKGAVIALISIVILPWLVSVLIIDWFGLYTNSVFVFITLHYILGFVFFVIGGMASKNPLFMVLVAGTGIVLSLTAAFMTYDAMGNEFDYAKRYKVFSNWEIPVSEE